MALPDEKRLLFEARGLLSAVADEVDGARALLYSDALATPSDVVAAGRSVQRMRDVLDVLLERLSALQRIDAG